MLIELEHTLQRLYRYGLSSSRAACDLIGLRNLYTGELARIASSIEHPHVMRILSEEAVESLALRMNALGILDENGEAVAPAYWRLYLAAVRSGEMLDAEYARYKNAAKLALLFLEQSYIDKTTDADYKTQRYAYALSSAPLPGWFIPGQILEMLEEIITAYGFLWFSVVDYAEGLYQAKGA